jgi:hypothetical protein
MELGGGTAGQEKQIAVDIFSTDFADSTGIALSICQNSCSIQTLNFVSSCELFSALLNFSTCSNWKKQ